MQDDGAGHPSRPSQLAQLVPASWALATAAVGALAGLPYWRAHPVLAVAAIGVPTLLAGMGATYAHSSRGRRMGRLFIIAALLHSLVWVVAQPWPIAPMLSTAAQSLYFVTLGAGALLYEQERYGTWLEWAWVVQAAVTLLGVQLLYYLMIRPEQFGYPPDSIWPTQIDLSPSGVQLLAHLGDGAFRALGPTLMLALAARRRQLQRAGHPVLGFPFLLAAAGLALLGPEIEALYLSVGTTHDRRLLGHVLQAGAATAIPLVLFANGALGRWREVIVTRRVVRECTAPSVAGVQAALRQVMGEATDIRLWVWLPTSGCYVAGGEVGYLGSTRVPQHRIRLTVPGQDAELGYAQFRATSSEQAHLVTTALQTLRPALRAVQAELGARDAVRAARARVLHAAEAGRREAARELQHQVRGALLEVAAELQRATTSSDREALGSIGRCRSRVESVIDQIRQIGRSVYPPMLVELGLAGALEELAERLGIRIALDLPPHRVHPTLELTLYHAFDEALVNCLIHAEATTVTIRVRRHGEQLIGEVTDDGRGGATMRLGGGLHAVQDRVGSLGGTVQLLSPRGGGTRVRVSLPAAPAP